MHAGALRCLCLIALLLGSLWLGPALEVHAEALEGNIPRGLEVHFLDVGQGDCILIRLPQEIVILIDGGDRGYGPSIVDYIQKLGIQRINYLVATHPHADHIGGLPDVIMAYPVDTILMPRTTHTTQTYEHLLTTIRDQGLRITEAVAGVELFSSGSACARIIAPRKKNYDKLNDFSAVLRLQFGDTVFLFTGDAEDASEREMLRARASLNADVLKVAHHGSNTSSSMHFLQAVTPSIAVISAGAGNRYGHPTQEVLDRLAEIDVTVYRTDEHGTVVVHSDGLSLKVETLGEGLSRDSRSHPPPAAAKDTAEEARPASPGAGGVPQDADDGLVHITPHGSRFHRHSCRTIRAESQSMTKQDAIGNGYDACQICKP